MGDYAPDPALARVRVSAFVGPAGTGKSQRAQIVADKLGAEYIIDDGLVVRKAAIAVGRSAKAERNQIRAIRRAMFEYDDHREAVKKFFIGHPDCSVMVIATSEGMADKIIRKLGLPLPARTVTIYDFATDAEIENARRQRKVKRQHVIPVSHVLVRQNFAGKLVGRLRVLWSSKSPNDGERTIVRPPFSFFGEVRIDPDAIAEIARRAALSVQQVRSVAAPRVWLIQGGDALRISVDMTVTTGPLSIVGVSEAVRKAAARDVGYYCGLDVRDVSVSVTGLEI